MCLTNVVVYRLPQINPGVKAEEERQIQVTVKPLNTRCSEKILTYQS